MAAGYVAKNALYTAVSTTAQKAHATMPIRIMCSNSLRATWLRFTVFS